MKSKEVPTLDQHLKLFDNPDGTHTLRIGIGPLKGIDEAGNGGDLDLSLVNDKAGNLRPHRNAANISIAPTSGAKMASVELAMGRTADLAVDGITSGVAGTRVPAHTGEAVRFDAVLPQSTSLLVRPRTDGVETTYEIQSATAAANLTEHITLPSGYTARQASGYIEIVDEKGSVAGRWIGGLATDSSPQALDTEVALQLQLVQGAVATAHVIVSPAWLADAKRVYPVSIDPSVVREFSSQSGYGATYIESGDAYPHWGIDPVRIGTYDGGANVNRTFIKFPIDGIPAHSRILNATMAVLETWSWSCQARAMAVHRVPNYWDGNITWATGNSDWAGSPESSISVAAGYTPGGCGAAWQFMDLSNLVADWYFGRYPLYGVMLKANNESDNFSWKKFAGSFSGSGPFVDVTYESFGTSPISVDDSHMQNPATVGPGYQAMTLTNQGSDQWPAYGPYQVAYHLYNSAGTFIHDGPGTLLPTTVNPGGSVALNANIEALPAGTYTVVWDMLEQNVAWFSSLGAATVSRSYRSNAPPTTPTQLSPAPGYARIPSVAFGAYPTSGSTTTYAASFEAWFKTTAGGVILGQTANSLPPGSPGAGWVPALYVDSTGALRESLGWHTNGSGNAATGPYNDAKPHHVVATYANGVDSLYVDGSLVNSTSANVTGFSNTYAYLLGTGYTTGWTNTYNGGWFPFAGSLDEVAVYSKALNLAQVQAHYGQRTGTGYKSTILGDGPTAYYRMDDAPGASTLADSSGQGNPASWSGGGGTIDASLLSGDSNAATGMGRAQVASLTPTLSASSTDPDGDSLQYLFRICSGVDAESGSCTDSGWINTTSWTVPAGKLSPATSYYWHTWVNDGGSWGLVSPPAPFSLTVTLPSTQLSWAFGFDPYAAYHGGVNTAIGNYVYSNTDFIFPSIGPPLQLIRTYNSLDMAPSGQGRWFGLGWTSTFETSLAFDGTGNGTVTYPDGRREFLTSNGDGTYAPAFGFASSMTKVVVSGVTYYDVKHRDQSVWRFNASGSLVSMTDAFGHQLQLVWSSTAVTITDPSGHSLAVTFSAPLASAGRVTQVASSPVTVGGSQQVLKWTYTYDSNGELATACDPSDTSSSRICTTYTNSGPGNRLTSIVRPNGNGILTLTYDTSNRVKTRGDGLNNTMTFSYGLPAIGAPSGTTATTSVTDALNHTTQSSYNNLNQLLQHVSEDGSARTYTFDQRGFLSSISDENGNVSTYTNDTSGNVLQFKDGAGDVTYYAYDSSNRRTSTRDPRSSGPTDNTYLTTYGYDSSGNLTTETTPTGTKMWTYSNGTEAAIGSGVMPPNLMLTATDAMGHATTFAYDSLGNPRRRTDPSGLVTDRAFDELSRELTRKDTSDTYPAGLLTTTSYDLAGRITQLTEPAVTNVVTSVTHQRTSTLVYDKNGNLRSVIVADATGGDASRTTSYAYDNDDRQTSVIDPLNHTSTTTYDAAGNVIQQKDALGRLTSTAYTVRNQPSTVALKGFIDDPTNPGTPRDVTLFSYTYDAGGRKLTETDAVGRVTKYAYDQANRLTTITQLNYHNRDNSTRDLVLETRSYDPTGNLKQRVEAGLRITNSTYDAAGRLLASAVYASADGPGAARTTTYAYDANGNVLSQTLSMGGSTAKVLYSYDLDQSQRQNKVEVVNQGSLTAPSGDEITTYAYDQRSLKTSMTEPRGNYVGANPSSFTTTFSYDPAGRLTTTVAPAVQVELGGPPATIPGAPTGVTATAGNGQATVSWTAPASNGGSGLTGYTVTASPGGLTATVNGSTTTATVTGLTNGTAYTFTVSATNAIGTGPASGASNSVTPTAPPATVASDSFNRTVSNGWGTADTGGAWSQSGSGYSVSPGAALITGQGSTLGGQLTTASVRDGEFLVKFQLTPANDGNSYWAGIRARWSSGPNYYLLKLNYNSSHAGGWQWRPFTYGNGTLTTLSPTPNAGFTPTAGVANTVWMRVRVTGASPTTIQARAWQDGSTEPTSWQFSFTDSTSALQSAGGVGVGASTWPLSANVTFNSFQVTDLSAVPTAPSAPTGVIASPGNGLAVVNWTAPSSGGSPITGYTVTASPGGQTATLGGGVTTATMNGLSNGTAYTFTVTATNAIGTSPASTASAAVTPSGGLTVPGAPTGVTATAGNGQATVSWTAPSSNGGSAITGFAVTASPGGQTASVGGGTTTTEVLGLNNGTGYTFTVTAANPLGTSPASAASGMVVPVAATSQQPLAANGYDSFGELTQVKDAAGNMTSYSYDALGRRTGASYPTYVTPGSQTVNASESWQYDAMGNVVKWTDRRGQTTSYDYNMRNRVVRQTDPKVSGQAAAGAVRYTYDDANNETSQLDQSGALQQWSYDDMNRVRTHTVVERVPAPTTNCIWTYEYDDLGRTTYEATPLNEVTTHQYDVLGDVTQETDPLGKVVTATYDLAGRLLTSTDQLGRISQITYDQAGNREQVQQFDGSGVRQAYASWFYDVAGNVVGTSQNGGAQTSYSLDALGHLISLVEPVSSGLSITTGFGYDANGNRTRVTDGNGHSILTSYNVWNLPQTRLEPSTAAYPNVTDRTWTWTYDAGGLLTTEVQPGGVTLSSSYDELGRPLQVVGTGASGSATSSYGWDLVGNQLSASSSGGSESFGYNDRGQLVSASGVGGSSSFTYDGDGQLVSRSDASGSALFGWSPRGELSSVTEPLTGVQETLSYDAASQLIRVAYGSGGPTRDNGYDGLGHLSSDVVKSSGGAVLYQAGYLYDGNGNLTQKTLGAGQAGAGTQSYGYDSSNRLVSWTDPTGNQTSYSWDAAGNRIQAGGQSFTYDERNRLVSGGGKTYTWTARGDIFSETTPTVQSSYSYDALGRLTQVLQTAQPPLSGTTTTGYAYDGLDRVVRRNSVAWSYAGQSSKPSSDGSTLLSREPSGLGLLATSSSGSSQLAIQGPHGDLEAGINSGGAVQGSFAYDPFGAPFSGNTSNSVLGYQGEWTDPATSKVSMAARWYDASSGRFLSQDTEQPAITGGVDTNLYAYGRANPLVNADPSGHDEFDPGGGGGGDTHLEIVCYPPEHRIYYKLVDSSGVVQYAWSVYSPDTCPPPDSSQQPPSGGQPPPDQPPPDQQPPGQQPPAGHSPHPSPLPAPPPPVPSSGNGRSYLPPGATAPTGLPPSLPPATPYVPPSSNCHGCTPLQGNPPPPGSQGQGGLGYVPGSLPGANSASDPGRCMRAQPADMVQSGCQPPCADLVQRLTFCQPQPEESGSDEQDQILQAEEGICGLAIGGGFVCDVKRKGVGGGDSPVSVGISRVRIPQLPGGPRTPRTADPIGKKPPSDMFKERAGVGKKPTVGFVWAIIIVAVLALIDQVARPQGTLAQPSGPQIRPEPSAGVNRRPSPSPRPSSSPCPGFHPPMLPSPC